MTINPRRLELGDGLTFKVASQEHGDRQKKVSAMIPKTIRTFQEQFLKTLTNGSQLCCRRRKRQVTNFNRRKTRVLIFTFRTGHLVLHDVTCPSLVACRPHKKTSLNCSRSRARDFMNIFPFSNQLTHFLFFIGFFRGTMARSGLYQRNSARTGFQ